MTSPLRWKTRYKSKRVTAETAVAGIRRGQRVFIGSGAAEPQLLVMALVKRGFELADTEIIHLQTLGIAPYTDSSFTNVFRHNALFIGPNVRSAVFEGRADYTPIFLSEIPRLFRSRRLPLDVALIQVSPPDAHGFCSLGVSVDIVKAAVESAPVIIAEVNPNMPRTFGDSFLHVDRLTHLVETTMPLLESVPAETDEVSQQIGINVAKLVDNGATLQVGGGRIPNAVLQALGDRRDLGIHTEFFSDGLLDLIESGAVTGARKEFLPGKIVTSFCKGTNRLYRFVHDNPLVEFHPSDLVNDPFRIAQNPKMVAINSAIEVDLTGQVCADSIGFRFYSGIGGQVDFMRGAARSPGGKPVIVLPSATKDGQISRIVAQLHEGAGVVTTRGDVHFVVTEYGIADLWGKSVRDRALALISIAHPKFRAELLEAAKRQHLVYQDQLLPPPFISPADWSAHVTLPDGTPVYLRPIRPTDETMMKDLFYSLSEQTIYQRFFRPIKAMPHPTLQKLVNLDYRKEVAIVGTVCDTPECRFEPDGERIIAVGRYVVDPETKLADMAFVVQDAFQGRGLGTILLQHLAKIAQVQGVAGVSADILAANKPMLHVFHKLGYKMETTLSGGVYHVEFHLNGTRN
ncbi:MAG: GNAT family N-acetyltransferase [Blastocatellia bacterium]|nr:GNAT family N-acetyltransferase [Blastocatellia bacterium]